MTRSVFPPRLARLLSIVVGCVSIVASALSAPVASAAPGSVAVAWGANRFGQLGDGSNTGSKVPVNVTMPPGVSFSQVSAGYAFTLALATDGSVWAWGNNKQGQLGDGTTTSRTGPVKVLTPQGATFTAVSAGGRHSIALASDGSAWAWGWNAYGQLGNGSAASSSLPTPVQMPVGVLFTAVSAGWFHSLALASNGKVWAWGDNGYGQLGDGTSTNRRLPVKVSSPRGVRFTQVSAGVYHGLALSADGTAWAWGSNVNGELGDGTRTGERSPVLVHTAPGITVTQVSAGYYDSLAVTSIGAALAWGSNYTGQLGVGTTRDQRLPVGVHLPSGVSVTQVSAGFAHSVALASDGTVWSWGTDNQGQLGDGRNKRRTSPVEVAVPGSVALTQVDAGGAHSVGLLVPAQPMSRSDTGARNMTRSYEASSSSRKAASTSSTGATLASGQQSGDWPKFRYDLANAGYNPNETTLGVSNVSGLQTKWTANTGDQVYSSPAVVGGVVYDASYNGDVYALDASTGAQLWITPTGTSIEDSSPTVAGGVLYIGSSINSGRLYALDANTGAILWSVSPGGSINASPVVDNGKVFVGSGDGSMYAFDTSTGSELWAAPTGGGSSAAVVNGVVYAGAGRTTVTGTMNAVDEATGTLLWTSTVGGPISFAPAVANGIVYGGSEDGHLYAFDATTGAIDWGVHVGYFCYTPSVANGVVYVGANPDGGDAGPIYAIDASTGAILWQADVGTRGSAVQGVAIANGVLYFGSSNGNVFAVEAATGSVLWQSVTGWYVTASFAVANGVAYVGSHDDNVYAYSLP